MMDTRYVYPVHMKATAAKHVPAMTAKISDLLLFRCSLNPDFQEPTTFEAFELCNERIIK